MYVQVIFILSEMDFELNFNILITKYTKQFQKNVY